MKVYGLAAVLVLMLGAIGCGSSNRFLYAVGPRTNSVLGFREASTGALSALASGFSTDSEPISIVVHPSGSFVYVANFSAGNVTIFSRDNKGGLASATDPTTSQPLGPVTVGMNPIAMAISPNGQFLYVLNQETSTGHPDISAFSVNNTSGSLTAIGAPVPINDQIPTAVGLVSTPLSIAVTANSKFLYVADPVVGTLAGFVVGSSGALSVMEGSPFFVGGAPAFLVGDPRGKFLYVANSATDQISAFALEPNAGTPSPVNGSPFAAGTTPVSLAIDSTGILLIAANKGSNNISAYSINRATGALSQVSGSPFATGTTPVFVAVDVSNIFVYVADSGSNDIAAFAVVGGTLKNINGSPFSITISPVWLTSH